MQKKYPNLYLRSQVYYFRYVDSHTGKRIQRCTGTGSKQEATRIMKHTIDNMASTQSDISLKDWLEKFTDPATNPRGRDALISGKNYSQRYALHVAHEAKELISCIPPKLLKTPLFQLSRKNIKDCGIDIIQKFGHTTKANKVFKLLKVSLTQAADDGYIQISPATGLADIKAVKKKKLYALQPADIRTVLSKPSLFPNEHARLIFTVLATTGLRRSELLALTKKQITGTALTVNRAYKDDSMKVIGLPKWDKVRVIALPHIAQEALKKLLTPEFGLGISSRTLSLWLRSVGQHAAALKEIEMPEAWLALTPHMLRHSLNTMLRISGLPDLLIAEFMSWEHQDLNKVQAGYTHLYAKNLQPVADMIDELLGEDNNDGKVVNITDY